MLASCRDEAQSFLANCYHQAREELAVVFDFSNGLSFSELLQLGGAEQLFNRARGIVSDVAFLQVTSKPILKPDWKKDIAGGINENKPAAGPHHAFDLL